MITPLNSLTLPVQFSPILSHRLGRWLKATPIVVALGSDKHTTDCFGPLAGYYLQAMGLPTFVYGNLNKPINANALPEIYQTIKSKHQNNTVVVLDSMIGFKHDVGKLKLSNEGLYPGSGIGKVFPLIGDISLTAIVTDKESFLKKELVGLGQIHKLAMAAAKIVFNSVAQYFNKACLLDSKSVLDRQFLMEDGRWKMEDVL